MTAAAAAAVAAPVLTAPAAHADTATIEVVADHLKNPRGITVLSDGTILVAEAEWSDRLEPKRLLGEIERKAANLPLAQGRKVIPAVFVKKAPTRAHDSHIHGPRQVLAALP